MADSYTPNLALTKPEVGASRDSWGAKWNDNADTLDEFVSMSMPLGSLLDYAGPTPPPGWLIADGRAVSRTTYSELFQVLATYWGAGDGSTTFNLPNFGGRVAVGAGAVTDENGLGGSYAFASRLGGQTRGIFQYNLPSYNLTTDYMAGHSHTGSTGLSGAHSHTTDVQGSHNHDTGGTGFGMVAGGVHSHSGWTDAQGAHNHTVGLWGMSAGTSGGGYGVMSDVFGAANYTTSIAPAHTHAVGTYDSPSHAHYIYWGGQHAHTVYGVGDHNHFIASDGGHAHTVASGGGNQPLDIRQPLAVVTKIIYAGSQAAPAAATAAVPLVRRLMSAPMRGTH